MGKARIFVTKKAVCQDGNPARWILCPPGWHGHNSCAHDTSREISGITLWCFRSEIGTPVQFCPSRPLGSQRIRIRKTGAWKPFIETYFTGAFLAIFKNCNFSIFHDVLDPVSQNLDPDSVKQVPQHWYRKLQVMAYYRTVPFLKNWILTIFLLPWVRFS